MKALLRKLLILPKEVTAEPVTPSSQLKLIVTVDYNKTVKQMVGSGEYTWKCEEITSQNFPAKKRRSGKVTIYLIHFDKELESDEVIASLDALGLRPAELPELLAIGREHPDLQREYTIVALGSVLVLHRRGLPHGGLRTMPDLHGNAIRRDLDLNPDYRRSRECRYAAVSKES